MHNYKKEIKEIRKREISKSRGNNKRKTIEVTSYFGTTKNFWIPIF